MSTMATGFFLGDFKLPARSSTECVIEPSQPGRVARTPVRFW